MSPSILVLSSSGTTEEVLAEPRRVVAVEGLMMVRAVEVGAGAAAAAGPGTGTGGDGGLML